MFRVLYSPGAAKALKKIPNETAKRIVKSIDALSEVDDPRRYIKKFKGSFGVPLHSFRVGDHRVILNVSDELSSFMLLMLATGAKFIATIDCFHLSYDFVPSLFLPESRSRFVSMKWTPSERASVPVGEHEGQTAEHKSG